MIIKEWKLKLLFVCVCVCVCVCGVMYGEFQSKPSIPNNGHHRQHIT